MQGRNLKLGISHQRLTDNMDRETQLTNELQALRALCDEMVSPEERQALAESLCRQAFVEPEHQVVFESICALIARGPFSAAQLCVHLNNRGFPDTDVEKYFQHAPPEDMQQRATNKATQ